MSASTIAKRTLRYIVPSKMYLAARRTYTRFVQGPNPGRALNFILPSTSRNGAGFKSDPQPNELELLGEKYQPTKREHDYLKHYWTHFRDVRYAVKNVCEIGLQTDRSILLWEEFFPNANIYGIDIDPDCQKFEGGRRKIFIGDQSDINFLSSFMKEVDGELDIVIDDGSHIVNHQLQTFEFLFPRLSTHGIYVIEDTGGVVGDDELYTIGSIKRLVDNIMYWPQGYDPLKWPQLASFDSRASWSDKNIVGVAFYRWIAFIFRGRNPEDNQFLQRI